MAQTREELAVAFRQLKGRISGRSWLPVPASAEGALYVTTGLLPRDAADPTAPWDQANPGADRPIHCFDVGDVAAFIDGTRKVLGVDLALAGGGYGCAELGFATSGRGAVVVEKAILEDDRFQELLADLRGYLARVRIAGTRKTYAAHRTLKIFVATTRAVGEPSSDTNGGLVCLYGDQQGTSLNHCMTEIDIIDGSPFGDRKTFLGRIWRRFVGSFSYRGDPLVARLVRATPLSADEFDGLIAQSGDGALTHVHGYANDFNSALTSFATLAYRTGLERLHRLPVLFSWPATRGKLDYHAQVEVAEVNDGPLRDLLSRLVRVAPPAGLDVLAHSHGCKIVAKALKGDGHAFGEPGSALRHAILVQADIGQAILGQALDDILSACGKLIIYHGADDLALRVSGGFARADRVGVAGLAKSAMRVGMATRVEQIDTTDVARGLVRHSPHLEAPEVVADICGLLQGEPPEKRSFIESVDPQFGQWRLRRAAR
jgi:hypothetical protein